MGCGFFGPANFTFRMWAGACELDFFACGWLAQEGPHDDLLSPLVELILRPGILLRGCGLSWYENIFYTTEAIVTVQGREHLDFSRAAADPAIVDEREK